MIELTDIQRAVTVGASELPILRGICLSIDSGETVAMTGPSGSGKSTLLNILGLLDRPTGGTYRLEGEEVAAAPQRRLDELRRDTIGFVFQAFHLLEDRTAFDNVSVGLIHARVPRRERADIAMAALDRLGVSALANRPVRSFSGGERQRVAIARAIAGRKRLLLCDEPTGNLDSHNTRTVLDLLLSLPSDGLTVVIVTHDSDVANACHRRVQLVDGALV